MILTPTLIKYLIHLGVQLRQSKQFVDNKDIESLTEKVHNIFGNLSYYTGRLVPMNNQFYKLVCSKDNNEEEFHMKVILSPVLNKPSNKIVQVYIDHECKNTVVYYDKIN